MLKVGDQVALPESPHTLLGVVKSTSVDAVGRVTTDGRDYYFYMEDGKGNKADDVPRVVPYQAYGIYYVFNPQGSKPTAVHSTRESAQKEAERLAKFSYGQKFYVLHAVDAYTTAPITVNHKSLV